MLFAEPVRIVLVHESLGDLPVFSNARGVIALGHEEHN
jgi:hypothetical protein